MQGIIISYASEFMTIFQASTGYEGMIFYYVGFELREEESKCFPLEVCDAHTT